MAGWRLADGQADVRRIGSSGTVESMTTARELTTLGANARAFAGSSSPRVILVSLVAVSVARGAFGGPTWLDLAMVAAVVVLVGPVEWVIHRWLLHAKPGQWLGEVLGTRDSHERHHRDPDDLLWLLLRRPNAIGSCAVIIVPMAAIAGTIDVWMTAESRSLVWGAALTAMAAGLVALAHYEWVHLLVHSRYQPTSAYYRRLDRHHRLHHFRNEGHWLGVTVNTADRLFGTLPADRSAVPLSSTVRSLDSSAR